MIEETIFKEGSVKITNLRAIIGSKTYAMSNITSVSLSGIEPSNGGAFASLLFGGLAGLASVAAQNWWLCAFFLLIAAFGGVVIYQSAPTYAVIIASASGETNALASKEEHRIRCIVEAINTAIVRRG